MESLQLIKAMPEMNMVFGLASVATYKDQPFIDKEHDHITQKALMKAWAEFMEGDERTINLEHGEDVDGKVVFCMPLDNQMKKALDIQSPVEGVYVGVKINNPVIMKAFVDGTLTGFSMEGSIDDYKVLEDGETV